MKSWGKGLLIIVVVGAFLIPMFIATRYVSLWHVYHGYVDTVSNLTGLNSYLTAAGAALLFVPFLIGVSWTLSWRSERRHAGEAILLGLFVLYNLGLFAGTRNAYFGFTKGETLKWYVVTRDGVQLYDRPGVDPKYGIALKPVTPDIVEQLDLMQKGEFKQIDPSASALFDYRTGKPTAWYWRDKSTGEWEFYNLPGFHPRTGDALLPVSPSIYSEWQRAIEKRAKQQAATATAARQEEEARQRAEAARGNIEANCPRPLYHRTGLDVNPARSVYEYAAKDLVAKLKKENIDAEDYPKGSEMNCLLSASPDDIDELIYEIFTDPKRGFLEPDGTFVPIASRSDMIVGADGQFQMTDPAQFGMHHRAP